MGHGPWTLAFYFHPWKASRLWGHRWALHCGRPTVRCSPTTLSGLPLCWRSTAHPRKLPRPHRRRHNILGPALRSFTSQRIHPERPPLPLLESPSTMAAGFVAAASRPLQQPLLPSTPPRRRPRQQQLDEDTAAAPRRSKRLATQVRVSNQTTQAQNVLMRKWGITSESRSPSADALVEYYRTYDTAIAGPPPGNQNSNNDERGTRAGRGGSLNLPPPMVAQSVALWILNRF